MASSILANWSNSPTVLMSGPGPARPPFLVWFHSLRNLSCARWLATSEPLRTRFPLMSYNCSKGIPKGCWRFLNRQIFAAIDLLYLKLNILPQLSYPRCVGEGYRDLWVRSSKPRKIELTFLVSKVFNNLLSPQSLIPKCSDQL